MHRFLNSGRIGAISTCGIGWMRAHDLNPLNEMSIDSEKGLMLIGDNFGGMMKRLFAIWFPRDKPWGYYAETNHKGAQMTDVYLVELEHQGGMSSMQDFKEKQQLKARSWQNTIHRHNGPLRNSIRLDSKCGQRLPDVGFPLFRARAQFHCDPHPRPKHHLREVDSGGRHHRDARPLQGFRTRGKQRWNPPNSRTQSIRRRPQLRANQPLLASRQPLERKGMHHHCPGNLGRVEENRPLNGVPPVYQMESTERNSSQ